MLASLGDALIDLGFELGAGHRELLAVFAAVLGRGGGAFGAGLGERGDRDEGGEGDDEGGDDGLGKAHGTAPM